MESQLTRAECLTLAGAQLRHKYGDAIPRRELQAAAAKLGGYAESSIIPSDHCYDMINQDPSSFVSHLFIRQVQGHYRFLDSGFPYTVPIFWKPKGQAPREVGRWENGHPSLTFDPRKEGD